MEVDLFGNVIEKKVLLRETFIEPPFSVIDSKSGTWQARKRKWKNLGIKSEVGRDAVSIHIGTKANSDEGRLIAMREVNIRVSLTPHFAN